ncbi:unnamed protein product [Caretta caretta]
MSSLNFGVFYLYSTFLKEYHTENFLYGSVIQSVANKGRRKRKNIENFENMDDLKKSGYGITTYFLLEKQTQITVQSNY